MIKHTEQAVIGSLMIKPSLIDDVAEILSITDFEVSAHSIIYATMLKLADTNQPIDILTVAETMGQHLDTIGGLSTLSTILKNTASAANALSYARVVKDHSNRKHLTATLTEALELAGKGESFEDAISAVGEKLAAIDPKTHGYLALDKIVSSRLAELERRSKNGGEIEGVTTGFTDIDQRLLGLAPGDLWVIGARPAMGKTALALNIATHAAKNFGPVLFFSCEMSRDQLVDRSLSSASKINGRVFRTGQVRDREWGRIAAGASSIKNLPIHIIDEPSIDANRAVAIARKFNRRDRLALIVVDYLQLLRFGKLTGYECVSEVSRTLKNMAKLTCSPVLALAQLNRAVESRVGDKRPNSADLRASGQIEQDADVISFIYRDEVYNPESQDKGIAELITTKIRNGEPGTDYLRCNLGIFTFENCERREKHPANEFGYAPFARGF